MSQVTLEQAMQIAVGYHQAGRLPEAEQLYLQILAKQPNNPDALNFLGMLSQQTDRIDAAIELINRAISINPTSDSFYCNLGVTLRRAGRLAESVAAYRQSIKLRPDVPQVHSNLSNVLTDLKEFDEAIIACRRAIEWDPNFADGYVNLGNALRGAGKRDEALFVLRQAVELRPNRSDIHAALAVVLGELGHVEESIHASQQALQLQPTNIEARWNLALSLLAKGQLQEGWVEHEIRLSRKNHSDWRAIHTRFYHPRWNGESLNGRRLFVYSEQGFGDTIQFIRYLPMLANRGGEIIFECQPELHRLLKDFPGIDELVPRGSKLPAFDLQIALLSLPRVYDTRLETIPGPIPYIFAEISEYWKKVVNDDLLNVGLCWAGSSRYGINRSIQLSSLAPLYSALPGAIFHSLQKGEASRQIAPFPLIDHTSELNDFADTAALIDNLDLVISIDTAVAHLAGAMGKPTWLLLNSVADWRWMLDRKDSPWYPTMRLYRQTVDYSWSEPIRSVADQLSGYKVTAE